MFQDAETLLCSQDWPAAQQLLGLAQQHLPNICDIKDVENVPYYRLDQHKVRCRIEAGCLATT
jgi:hypothetical protein